MKKYEWLAYRMFGRLGLVVFLVGGFGNLSTGDRSYILSAIVGMIVWFIFGFLADRSISG